MEYEYDKSEFQSLAFTIKKLKDPKLAEASDYHDVFNIWINMGVDLYNVAFERDSNGILHAHGRLICKKNFYKKRLQTFGFHVYIRDIFYEDGWSRYINKEKQPLENHIDNKVYMF